MRLSDEVRSVIDVLLDEDYGWLAAEIIERIEASDLPNATAGDVADYPDLVVRSVVLDAPVEMPVTSSPAEDREAGEPEPVPQELQLRVAIDQIRLRVVEPIRRLAEAERIAGRLAALPPIGPSERERGGSGAAPFPPRPRFVTFGRDGEVDRPPGDARDADDLASVLGAIVPDETPPESRRHD